MLVVIGLGVAFLLGYAVGSQPLEMRRTPRTNPLHSQAESSQGQGTPHYTGADVEIAERLLSEVGFGAKEW